MADARSFSGSFFSICSTNSGGSSTADAGVDEEDVVVVIEEEIVAEIVLDGRVIEEFCSSSSDGISPATDDDADATIVVKVDINEEDIRVLLKVGEELRSDNNSGNDDLLEVELHGPLEIGDEVWVVVIVDAQLGEVEVVDGDKVALDRGRMSKSSGRKKHHEFHFSGDDMANDSPEAVDGDDNGVCSVGEYDSDWIGVDSLNRGESVCKDFEGSVSEDSDKEDFEDPDVEGPDEGDCFVLLLILLICLNWTETHWLSSFDSRMTDNYLLKDGVQDVFLPW